MLGWAVEEASLYDIPNAPWLYTMTVATTGQALKKGVGWRKAYRFHGPSAVISMGSV